MFRLNEQRSSLYFPGYSYRVHNLYLQCISDYFCGMGAVTCGIGIRFRYPTVRTLSSRPHIVPAVCRSANALSPLVQSAYMGLLDVHRIKNLVFTNDNLLKNKFSNSRVLLVQLRTGDGFAPSEVRLHQQLHFSAVSASATFTWRKFE